MDDKNNHTAVVCLCLWGRPTPPHHAGLSEYPRHQRSRRLCPGFNVYFLCAWRNEMTGGLPSSQRFNIDLIDKRIHLHEREKTELRGQITTRHPDSLWLSWFRIYTNGDQNGSEQNLPYVIRHIFWGVVNIIHTSFRLAWKGAFIFVWWTF